MHTSTRCGIGALQSKPLFFAKVARKKHRGSSPLSHRYDGYGRGQGDLAQFMKAQVVSENGDDTIDGSGDVGCRLLAPKALMKPALASVGSSDYRQGVALLKPVVATFASAVPSNAIKFVKPVL